MNGEAVLFGIFFIIVMLGFGNMFYEVVILDVPVTFHWW